MTPLPILLAAIFLGTGNCSYKIVHFFLQYGRLDVLEVKAESVRALSRYFGMKFLSLEKLGVWPLSVENKALLTMQFQLIVVSIFLKTCVKDHGDSSSRLLERRI